MESRLEGGGEEEGEEREIKPPPLFGGGGKRRMVLLRFAPRSLRLTGALPSSVLHSTFISHLLLFWHP